ncbi:Transcriptional activator of fatty acid utilization, partial [Rhizopus stolonifer]
CQDLKLHNLNETLDISQEEKETRRRTWWSFYVLDRWIAGDSGRPFTAIDEDIDEPYPSEYASFDEVMDSMTDTDQNLPRFPSLDKESSKKCKSKMVPIYQPFIQMIKLSRILGMILKNLYTPQGKKYCAEYGSDSVVGYLDNALSEWRANLPPLLNISSAGKMSSKNEEHIPLISMTGPISLFYYTSLILLHRPFIKHDPENKKLSSQTSLTICTSAAIKVIEISECMNYRDFLLVSWCFALYPLVSAILIHAFNAQSSDKTITTTAKSNLVRGLALMDKLNSLSPFKEHVENTIRTGILNSNLCKQDPELVQLLEAQQKSKIKFVLKGTTNQESKTTQESETSESKNSFEYKTDECITPLFTDDYHWLDMLYVSSQNMLNQNMLNQNMFQETSNMQQSTSEDMYSIRQFGFNTAGLDPLSQPWQGSTYIRDSNNNQLYTTPYINSNQNMLNSFQSNLPFGEQYTMGQTNTDMNHSLSNDLYSNASYGPPLLHNLETITGDSFWGVPDSMNIEDWYARLIQGEFQ